MTWSSRYSPPDATNWRGRTDTPPGSSFFQLIQVHSLLNDLPTLTLPTFAFIGFCCDEGIRRNLGRVGAADGPKAIRQALAKLALTRPSIHCLDVGDITCTDNNLESAQDALAEVVATLLTQGVTPIVFGGGHEVAWGHYQGIAKAKPSSRLGILNFDAHFDMRPLLANDKGSSGTPFLQIANAEKARKGHFDYHCVGIQSASNTPALFNTAEQHHVHVLLADQLHQAERDTCDAFIKRMLANNDCIYTTLCLDVFAAPFAPGVSAPQAFGLAPWHLQSFIRQVAHSGKVISYDIAELSPHYDVDQRTAKLAAHFIYEIIHHHDFISTK